VQLFYPYAYGLYVKITSGSEKGRGVVVSKGKNNLALFSMRIGGAEGGDVFSPLDAYTRFVSGKYSVLYGTQRDVYRLTRRGVTFNVEPQLNFTDLVQYVAVTAKSSERIEIASRFSEFLVSDISQQRLCEIGLFSPTGYSVEYDIPAMNEMRRGEIESVLYGAIEDDIFQLLSQNDGKDDFFEKFNNYIMY
jgi:hypothetical protein